MLTTGRCAELLNQFFDSPGGFTADFVRGQIIDGKLHARINVRGNRARARIRVHPDDFLAYVERYHAAVVDRARHHLAA